MRSTALKPFRVVFSLVTFFLTVWIFVDFSGRLTHELTRGILFFQFVPSAVTLFHFFTGASFGCIFIVLLTLLFGRVYCSFLCPLGTLQDLIIGIRSRIRKKYRFRFMKPQPWVQYSLLALTVIPLFFGSLFFLNLLDPYSFAGKIFSSLFRPAVYFGNNLLVWVLNLFNIFSIYPVEWKYLHVPSFVFASLIFTGLLLLAVFKGRWYCNAICPVGTVLGFLSRFSLWKIRIREENCTRCGLCAHKCKAGCIDVKSGEVDFTRCVACYNCFRACHHDGFSYSFSIKSKAKTPDASRRTFLKQTSAGIMTLTGVVAAGPLSAKDNTVEETPKPGPATPPGSLSIWNFTSACTACHLCITACPTRVLQPSFFEYGLQGMFMPRMNFEASFCNFDCIACTQVCPTEAIRSLTVEQKHVTQIGVSKFIKNICVVVEKKTACGACSEHCPTKAVEMVPYIGTLTIPEINEKICIGCGACEFACPTRPIRAIYVEPRNYHRVAMKPLKKVQMAPDIKKSEEEFPF